VVLVLAGARAVFGVICGSVAKGPGPGRPSVASSNVDMRPISPAICASAVA
jgi:hypothetical protein